MKKILKYLLLCLPLMLVSCIENDLSYPNVSGDFLSLELDGQKAVTIDKETRTIEIVMGESADMSHIKVLNYSLTDGAEVIGGMPVYLDLRESVSLTVHIYKDYQWTLKASQPIERYIRVDNQVGEAEIDVQEKIAYVYVSESQSIAAVKFNEMKLEPEGAVLKTTQGFVNQNGVSMSLTEACNLPMVLDCVIMRYFFFEYQGEEIRWSVKVLQKVAEVGMKSVNPWTYSAGVSGVTNGSGIPVFEYRKASDSQWTTYSEISMNGSTAVAEIRGLEPDTDYLVRLSNGTETTEELSFKTGRALQLENLNFDNWSKNDKYPNADGRNIWDSANSSGATTTTTPVSDAIKGKAARLESVSAFGLLAAGNIFTGSFIGLAGLGAELDWGTPFEERPLAMKGYFKYAPVKIDKAKDPYKDRLGQDDQCQILAFLTDWDGPFRVNTNSGQFVDLDKDSGIIALGLMNTSETIGDYVEFTIPLKYRDASRTPKYIVIAAASSRYGDYYTGGIGSVL